MRLPSKFHICTHGYGYLVLLHQFHYVMPPVRDNETDDSYMFTANPLKKDRKFDNFVVTGGAVSCHYDKIVKNEVFLFSVAISMNS